MATYESPDRSEWKSVWLGTDTTPPDEGWYPVEGEVRTTRLATFERKVTIGDATRDSDDFISSWVIGDFSGGGQILDINEGSDTDRFWWGVADTRFQNQSSLPPEVVEYTLSGTAGTNTPTQTNNVARPVGDVPDGPFGVASVFYVHYNNKLHGMTTAGFPSTQVVSTTVPPPSHEGVPFKVPSTSTGTTGGYMGLVVPSAVTTGSTSVLGSYYLFSSSPGGIATVIPCSVTSSYIGTNVAMPATAMCAFNDVLYATDGYAFWKSANGRQFTDVIATGTTMLRMPRGQVIRKLVTHMIGAELKLLAITDEQVWMLNNVAGGSDLEWVDTPLHYPQSRSNGLAATRWRMGEDMWIAVGPDLVRFTTSSVIVPNAGPIRDDGLPSDMYGSGGVATLKATVICSLVGDHNFLYALLAHNNGTRYPDLSLMCWTGTGWHCLWQGGKLDLSSADIGSVWMSLSRGPNSSSHDDYYLMIGSMEQKVYGMKLRTTFHNVKAGARAGIDRYNATTTKVGTSAGTQLPWIETGRFDANMVGFKKLASHLQVGLEYADGSNGIRLYYQTDADVPATVTSSDYTVEWKPIPTAGTIINKVGLTNIELPGTGGFNKGIPFQWIRFKVEFDGQGGSKTPILNHLVLSYTKIPQDAASFVLTIPLPRETYLGRTGQEMADDLQELLVSNQFIKMVHQNKTYRVRVAGLSGADSTGDDLAGARTVNLIEIEP